MNQPEVHNLTRFAFEPVFTVDEECRPILLTVVKGTYTITSDGQVSIAETQVPVDLVGRYYGDPEKSSYKYEPESAIRKLASDVVLIGHAYAAHLADTETMVSLRVGTLHSRAKVTGDRMWIRALGMIYSTPPEPFERLPLVYERAFGGWDRTTPDKDEHHFESRNPVGTGFRCKNGRFEEGVRLPNVEHPDHPIRAYGDVSPPVGFGFVSPNWQPRARLAGTYGDAWRRSRMPFLPFDFDPRFFNAAAPALTSSGYLRGDEYVLIEGASSCRRLSFQLPAVPPPVIRVGLHRGIRHFLPTVLDTVIINTDENLLLLIWRTSLRLDNGPEDVKSIKIKPENFTPRQRR